MELQAVTGQLYVVNGEVRDASLAPGLAAERAPTGTPQSRRDDLLFLHLTLSGRPEESEALAAELLAAIRDEFYQAVGSVTAALRKAILAANQRLLAFNLGRRGPAQEAALACAALHGQELFSAQAGEAVALLAHNFGIERLPAALADQPLPLGRSAGAEIRFFHHWLQAGDILLLADPRLAHLSADDLRPALIDTEAADSLHALKKLVGPGSGRLILIEFTDEAPADVADRLPRGAKSGGGRLSPPKGAPQRGPSLPPAGAPPPQPKVAAGLPDVEEFEAGARLAGSRAARGLAHLTGSLARLLTRLGPVGAADEPEKDHALPAFLAIILPLVVAAVVTGVYLQRGQTERYSEIKQALNQQLGQAEQLSADRPAAIAAFTAALRLANEGLALRPGDDDLLALRDQALEAMDDLSGVARLTPALLYEYPAGTQLGPLALGDALNGDIYILERAGGAVYRHDTDEGYVNLMTPGPEQIVAGGQAVGSHVVGQIVDTMWRPSGAAVARDGLAMLDARGAVVTFYPSFSDLRAAPLDLASEWRQPAAIASFDERLYLLDRQLAEIWRYFPAGEGFSLTQDQKTLEFQEDPGLAGVVDLAIYADDGSVVLLYADGRLRRYVNGRLLWSESELAANGLEQPLVAPVSLKIAGRGLNSSLFILDPGSARVVQLSLGGTYLAEFKAQTDAGEELFAQAGDLDVAAEPMRLFVGAGNRLYRLD
ncbi:MAG: hypothetical protein ACRDHL_04630 [Candidatus Promineifilaceae bacterium]